MTDNTDAKIAREWAEKIAMQEKVTFSVDEGTLAAACYILATAPLPPMSDVEWDDSVHAGLCAEHPDHGVVRMIRSGENLINCLLLDGSARFLPTDKLTPIPGTRLDLTPRREPGPESTPDHPTELTTEADYRNAPEGTIVAAEDKEAWTKGEDGSWETWGIISGYNNYVMADGPRRVLRWGWEA